MAFSKLSGRLCVFLILVVGALAHGLCLGAEYYMDDYVVRSPEFLAMESWPSTSFRILPMLLAVFTDRIFPGSSVAQHIWNLLIHLILAVTIFWGARVFLEAAKLFKDQEQTRRAAFFGALIFACHPICSEALNYSRCTMIQMVALFSVLAAIGALKFCQRPNLKTGLWTLTVIVLAAFSKDPGVMHAVGNVMIVVAVFANWERVTQYLRRPIDWAVAVLSVMAFFWIVLHNYTIWWLSRAISSISGRGLDFGDHALTQGRVFWAYVQRMVAPVNLSVDHHVPYTNSMSDLPAVLMTVAVILLAAGLTWMMFVKRTRIYGVIGMLGIAPLLLRFMYPISELMVEYRVYPAMPWLALLAGIGLAFCYQKNERVMRFVVLFLVVGGVTGSVMRSLVWQDAGALAQNVVDQYPTNNRARGELQRIAYEYGDNAQVLALRKDVLGAVDQVGAFNLEHQDKGRGFMVHRTNEFYLFSEAKIALVLAESVGSKVALDFISQIETKTRLGHADYFDEENRNHKIWQPMEDLRELIHKNGAAHDRELLEQRQASAIDPNEP